MSEFLYGNGLCNFCGKGHKIEMVTMNGVTLMSCPNIDKDKSYLVAKSTPVDSPRARDVTDNVIPGCTVTPGCMGRNGHVTNCTGPNAYAQNAFKGVNAVDMYARVKSERDEALAAFIISEDERNRTHKALAVSEKERERLRQAGQELRHELDIAKTCIDCGSAAKERDTLRRELENLKRSTDSTIHDRDATVMLHVKLNVELTTENTFLKRELERERAKKKRGL
jgi:hypothetical protein